MRKIKYWGINFRSKLHLSWFKLSLTMLCITLGGFLSIILPSNAREIIVKSVCILLALIHGGAFSEALIKTKIKNKRKASEFENEYYGNCVWFNGALFIIYAILLFLLFFVV